MNAEAKLRVLHLTHHFWPCIGGVEKAVQDLCIELEKKEIESEVLCLNKCPAGKEKLKKEELFENKIPVHRVSFIDMKYYKPAFSALLFPKKEFDLIHAHGIGFFSDAVLLTKFLHKKPVVVSTYGLGFHTNKMIFLKKIYFNFMQKLVLRLADKIIVISKADEEKAKKISKNIIYAPLGVELKKNSSAAKQKNSFLFVGRLSKNKRIDLLIDAFLELIKTRKDAKLSIAGSDFDGMKKEFEEKIRKGKGGKNIFLLDSLSDEGLHKKYFESEFFISASEYESFGISVIEAMGCGCIPILNDIPAFKEIVKNNENGFIAEFEKNPAAEIIRIMNADEKQKQKISENAAKKASEFAWEKTIKKYAETYSGCTGKKI